MIDHFVSDSGVSFATYEPQGEVPVGGGAQDGIQAPVGEKVTLGEVLLVGSAEGEAKVGSPLLDKASVAATVVESGRDHKVRVFKYKKRKHYRRTRGHRQGYTALRIDGISL